MRLIGLLLWATVLFSCAASATDDMPSASARLASPVLETGTLEGASYRIDIPAKWNHDLVVYYHGYAITPVQLPASEPIAPQLKQLVDRGYAVVQSAYSQTGWAVEQGYTDSERLRRHFVEKHGKPRTTFAAGMSMGGTLTVMALEMAPETYAGGLSLCGAIMPTDRLVEHDFALRAAFDYYFPDLLGPLVPVAKDFLPTAAIERKIAVALQSKPQAAAALLRIWGVGDLQTLTPILSFNTYEVAELQQRTHGNPFANADLIYTGSGDDYALNKGVTRYRADALAAAYLARWYTPSGKLTRPLLALHDTADPLVPASSAAEYALLTRRSGHADNFVQQFVNKEGHCVFTPQEIGHAFDEMVDWVHDGKRPPSGPLP
ncbi:MAG TPA: alpha/beta hydrolase [Rudaea sp.]|jgi:pimeloyl-ACP methyl ester carboxylesterase